MSKPIYNCSQNAFVSTATKGINLCQANLAELQVIKPFLSEAYFEQMKLDLKAADLLPDSNTRRALTSLASMVVKKDREELLLMFDILKSNVADGHPAETLAALYATAGNANFAKAKNGSWNDLKGLLSSALPFIAEQKDDLIKRKFMHADFPAAFETAAANMEANYAKWDALSKGVSKADEKVDAFNAIYTKLDSALTAGKLRFVKTNPALSEQFSFTTLLAQTQGVRNAGLEGKVTGENDRKLHKAVLSIEGTDKIVETDEEGKYELGPLSMGKYNVLVQCEGYQTQRFEDVSIKTGVTSRLNVKMVAVAATS